MVDEVLALLPAVATLIGDMTVGGGGHAEALLQRAGREVELIGFDRDVDFLNLARERLRRLPNKISYFPDSYANVGDQLGDNYRGRFDFLLLDLGLSSWQLQNSGRGFSFTQSDEPLDLRFDATSGQTLSEKLSETDETGLATILREFGEIRGARRLAAEIKAAQAEGNLNNVGDLAGLAERHVRTDRRNKYLAQVWQALRIWVNEELKHLDLGLTALVAYLKPAGVMTVISFHSLEDRMVKKFFARQENPCICPPRLPQCVCGRKPTMKRIGKKAQAPSDAEVRRNPRARSARLRAARRLFDS